MRRVRLGFKVRREIAYVFGWNKKRKVDWFASWYYWESKPAKVWWVGDVGTRFAVRGRLSVCAQRRVRNDM